MAVIDWPIDWRRATRTRRTAIAYTRKGQLIVQAWPRPRGHKRLTQLQRDQMEWFAQAVRLAKYAPPLDVYFRRIYTHRSMRRDRDMAISAMAGRLFPTLLIDGVRYYSMSVLQDISVNLDLFGATPGSLLVRGPLLWAALAPGNEEEILRIVSGIPKWAPGDGGPTPGAVNPHPYANTTGNTGVYPYRCLANHIEVHQQMTVTRLGWIDNCGHPGDPRKAYLVRTTEPGATSEVLAVLAYSETLVPAAGPGSNYYLEFLGPATLTPGNYYAVALAIQRGAVPTAPWLNYFTEGYLRTYWPVEKFTGRWAIDKILLEPGDILTRTHTTNVHLAWTF